MRAGGTLVIDFLNASQVRNELVPYDERVENGSQSSRLERLPSTIGSSRKPSGFASAAGVHRAGAAIVRDDLERMLTAAGFEVEKLFGDYGGGDWVEDSPRTIFFASRR